MVQRQSAPSQVIVGPEPRITAQALGQVAARSAAGAFSTHVATAEVAPVGTLLRQENTLLSNALNSVSNTLGQMVEAQRRRAYVDGSVAAVVGQSREAIEASPITRAWANAGFNDTKGNLALADYQAQVLNDMPKLREQGPEAMQQHILKQRNTVVPALEGMSTEAKIKAYESLATTDASLINKHYVEHSKFITEQKVKGIETQLNVALSAIEGSRGEPSYEAALESAYTTLVSTVVTAEDLPQEVRDSMVVDFLTAAMAQGDLGMYEYARARPLIDDGQGGTLALTRLLSMKEQRKLSNDYDKYQRRWAFLNDQDIFSQLLDIELSLERGEDVPVEVQRRILQHARDTRALTNEGANAKFLKWARQSKSVQDSKDLALAYVKGDITTLARSGKSNYEVAKSVESILAPNGSATELFMLHLDTGLRTGSDGALHRAGELLKPTINAALTADVDSQIDPSHTELFEYYVNVESQARNNGLSNFRSNVLSLLSDDQKVFFNNIISRVQSGNSDVVTAIQEARNDHHKWGSLSPAARASIIQGERPRVTNTIDSILGGDTNILNIPRFFHKVVNAVGIRTNEGMADTVRAKGFGWGHNDTANSQYRSNMNILLHNAAENLLQRGAFLGMGDSDIKELLLSEAIKHVAPIPYGNSTTNMVLPLNSNLGTLFGFADGNVSYGSEELGRAIGAIIEEGRDKDAHPLVQYDNGVVTVSMFKGEDVYPASVYQLSVEDIQDKAREIRRLGSIEEVKVYGTGHTVKGANGAAVTFNGENTANVHPSIMFRIRESLVKFEGVKNKAYPDGGGGKQSVGVGINTGLAAYYPPVQADGTVTNEDISKSFRDASDYFVSKVKSYDAKWGGALKNDPNGTGLEFLTHLLYQTGERDVWFKHGPTLIEAMASKPVRGDGYMQSYQEALKVFRKFGVGNTAGGGNRVKFYEDLLFKYFKGY